MSENKDIQGKSTQLGGLKKSIHKSVLKDGEYHHLKNGITSSFEGDMPFIQNAPSNLLCVEPPVTECVCDPELAKFTLIGSKFVKEKDFHILFYVNPTSNESEIGFFYGNECRYEKKIREKCLNFNVSYPIKCTYQYFACELNIYFQDGFNRDRHINLDDLPYVKRFDDAIGCYVNTDVFDCSIINVQNDLTPPVVKPINVLESGALRTGVYQFAVCYANINGDEQSSYYSKTNPLPIFEDRIGGYENVEGSKQNQLTDKSIEVEFSNLDIRYEYFNLAVIKTIQGTPTYELVATLPISTDRYIYTGREVTKLLSIDSILGLYPDYYNSKTLTTANNYLVRANLSTQDEANYQPLANIIELEWVAIDQIADTYETTYKNPLNTVNIKGYQRGEVYAFGIQFLLKNGRKTSVFHIPGREAKSSDKKKYTRNQIPTELQCNFYELFNNGPCDEDLQYVEEWQIYDTATVTINPDTDNPCGGDVKAHGDFAYWESSDTYPCNESVWKGLSGQKIRHHKFPSNNTFHHHDQPYPLGSSPFVAYTAPQTHIYPMGVRLKTNLEYFLNQAVYNYEYLTEEEADLIAGYEIVRGDRTGNKSIIAKGLLYNMKYYTDKNPQTGDTLEILYPNYAFNDLRSDPYLTPVQATSDSIIVSITTTAVPTITDGQVVPASDPTFQNPFPESYIIDLPGAPPATVLTLTQDFTIEYTQYAYGSSTYYSAKFIFYGADADSSASGYDPFTIFYPSIPTDAPLSEAYRKNYFTFHSPDTSFKQPFLGQELTLHSVEYGAMRGRFDTVEGHPEIKPAPASSSANYAVAFKGVSNYNNYVTINEKTSGNFRRRLEDAAYFVGNSNVVFPNTFYPNPNRVNNKFRESNVGLRLHCDLDNPETIDANLQDESRYNLSSSGKCGCTVRVSANRVMNSKEAYEVDNQCTEDERTISSYYGSLKRAIANQYGLVETVKYVLTGKYFNLGDWRNFKLVTQESVFGGDTFITRFSLKRKHSFFTVNFIGQSPVGMSYAGDKYANVLRPIYALNNEKGGILKDYVVDTAVTSLDCSVSDNNGKSRNGFFYLFNIGIVDFFVESDINTELRYSGANVWETWYPKLKGVDTVWDWMEEIKCSINFDNVYNYNFDYSKQNVEEALTVQAADFNPNSQCKNTHPRRVIYSKQQSQEGSADEWLVYPANQYYDIDTALGSIVDIEALDTFRVLVRCENGSLVFNAYDTLQLTNTSVTVGTGGMFSQRPQTFGETDNGYAGSQSKWAIDISQYGTFFLDAKRGKVFNYSSGLEEISNTGMFDWFNENTRFKILSQIPTATTDNPYTGIGYCSVFDNRLNLWFLTKRDFLLKDKENVNKLTTDDRGNVYYDSQLANFEDDTIWENVGWTISYSPLYKAWQSFHSFIPNYYIPDINQFYSGLKRSAIYTHWDKFTFQNYYGKQYPFEVTITTAKEQLVSVLQSIEYNLKVQKYLNNNYQDLYENHNINFTKAIIATDNQSSGYLNLIKKDNANPYQSLQYPKVNPDSLDILYSKVEGHKYRINQFSDLVLDKNNDIPIFLYSLNGVDFVPNNIDYAKVNTLKTQPLRNEFFDVTLINDQNPEYKFILKTLINKTVKSLR
jgi:hypothetical protein